MACGWTEGPGPWTPRVPSGVSQFEIGVEDLGIRGLWRGGILTVREIVHRRVL